MTSYPNRYLVEPFREEHLAEITLREQDGRALALFGDPKGLAAVLEAGHSWTGRADGQIVLCAGLLIPWRGLAEAWAVTSPEIDRHRAFAYRTVRRILGGLIEGFNLHRVQTVAPADHVVAHRWLAHLGFDVESVLEAYGPAKEDYIRFALIPGRN